MTARQFQSARGRGQTTHRRVVEMIGLGAHQADYQAQLHAYVRSGDADAPRREHGGTRPRSQDPPLLRKVDSTGTEPVLASRMGNLVESATPSESGCGMKVPVRGTWQSARHAPHASEQQGSRVPQMRFRPHHRPRQKYRSTRKVAETATAKRREQRTRGSDRPRDRACELDEEVAARCSSAGGRDCSNQTACE